jgi:F420H(2)-dependent quinone reductase
LLAHGFEDRVSTTYSDFNKNLIADLRANGGQATSGPFRGGSVLILTTTGAKSGEMRENPLAYTRAGVNYVVIASKGGAPTHPA